MIRKFGKLSLVVSIMLILAACGGQGGNEAQVEEPEVDMGDPVAIVNGENIYEVEYESMTEKMIASYEQQGIELGDNESEQMLEQIRQQALDQMIQQEVLLQNAERSGLIPSEETVEEEIDSIRSQFESDEEYEIALEQNMLTENELKETLEKELSIEAYIGDNIPEVDVTDEEIEEYYRQYKTQQEEQIKAMEASGEDIQEDQMAMMEVPGIEEIKEELKAGLIQQKEQEHLMALIDELLKDSDIEILI